jgi:hypothetical protein
MCPDEPPVSAAPERAPSLDEPSGQGWLPPPADVSPPFVPSTDAKAIASLALGALCLVGTFCWMGLLLGVPAIALGATALRDIRRAHGMTAGRGMASAGIAMGTVGSVLFVGWVSLLLFALLTETSVVEPVSTPTAREPVPPLVETPRGPIGGWGSIRTIELHASGGPLRVQLAEQASSAKGLGETVLVETSTENCDACDEILEAMGDPLVQDALSSARLVRLDADELASQLAAMHMSEPSVPWFYLIDAAGGPRDGISADEWDENVPTDMAPVLRAFVHGRLTARRVAWRGVTSL